MSVTTDFVINRRPFELIGDKFYVNKIASFDIAVTFDLFDARRESAERLTNDRFEQILNQSEGLFGTITEARYNALIESFVEIVVKSCCSPS